MLRESHIAILVNIWNVGEKMMYYHIFIISRWRIFFTMYYFLEACYVDYWFPPFCVLKKIRYLRNLGARLITRALNPLQLNIIWFIWSFRSQWSNTFISVSSKNICTHKNRCHYCMQNTILMFYNIMLVIIKNFGQ